MSSGVRGPGFGDRGAHPRVERRWSPVAGRASGAAVVGVLALVAVFAAAAGAQPAAPPPASSTADAPALFEQGVAATDRGDFAAGLRAFEAAYALNPLPDTLYNIAMCRMALEDWVGAANTFRDYVAVRGGRLPPDEQAEFDRLQAELMPRIGRLAITVGQPGAVVSIDGVALGAAPLPAWVAVAPGRHTVAAQKDGFERASSVVDAAPGQLLDVPLVLVAVSATPEPPGPSAVRPPPSAAPLSPWFWTSVAVGGAAAVGMAITGGLALKYKDDYAATDYTDGGLHDTAADLGLATDVLLGVALAGAAAALIVGLWPADEEAAAEGSSGVGLLVVPGGVAVSW